VGEYVRLTVEQNLVLRWVRDADLPALFEDLKKIALGSAGAESIADITACPGTDTCKLGIASSRGLAGTLMQRLDAKLETLPEVVRDLKVKISGCFNSCGQHHVADIGFYGNSRKVGNYKVPHFQVVLGGQWQQNAGSYGLAIAAVPSKLVPEALETITERFVKERQEDESFQAWVTRIGKKEAREILRPYMINPVYETQPEFFSDWRDPRVFTLSDLGIGECAGEVVSLFSMEIARAESEVFEAQIALDEHRYAEADRRAYRSMLMAARALLRSKDPQVSEEPDEVVAAFREQFYDTELFFDQFARGKFGRYLFSRHERPEIEPTADPARQTIEEAQLFIEAAHACDMRINSEEPAEKAASPTPSGKLPPGFASKLPPKMPPKVPSKLPTP
jgi:sulfite reductase (ferredoxin)